VNPFATNPWWCFPAAVLPALLAMILIFMDQQITAVIVNRKENKLRVSGNVGLPRYRLRTFGSRTFSVVGQTVWDSLLDSLRDLELSSNSFGQLKSSFPKLTHSIFWNCIQWTEKNSFPKLTQSTEYDSKKWNE